MNCQFAMLTVKALRARVLAKLIKSPHFLTSTFQIKKDETF